MKGLTASLWAEALKILKSKIFWVSILFMLFVILAVGFMMFIMKDPESAKKYGLIGTKAAITAGKADWMNYHMMLVQVTAIAGLLGFGFVTIWIFGREYSDHTVKDLLALPVARHTIVLSKFIAASIWCLLLAAIIFPFWLLTGQLLSLPGWNPVVLVGWIADYAAGSSMIILLITPVAFFASAGRGFLPPIGFLILTIALTNLSSVMGYGQYFPWAIPAYYIGIAGPENARLGTVSYIIYSAAVAAGLFGTFSWWSFADQA